MTGHTAITPKSYGKSIKPSDLPTGITLVFPISEPSNSAAEPPLAVDGGKSTESGGFSAKLLLPVLEGILELVRGLEGAVRKTEVRMPGVSVLIVWEGEEKTLEAALAADSVDMDSDSEEEEEGGTKKLGPPFIVRLIDFAHTYAAPGRGPDEGVLKGLQTVIKLLEGRIDQVRV